MIERRTKLLQLDMRDQARLAIDFLGDLTAQAVQADIMRLYAMNRVVEIVSEAANKVDPAQRQATPGVPWRSAIGMRNVLIHGYDRVKVGVVVDTVRNNFPNLIAEIDRILTAEAQG